MVRDAKEVLNSIRDELKDKNKAILENEYLKRAERGELKLEDIKLFVTQQYYIVSHDVRSIAIMLSRSRNTKELNFFHKLVLGDKTALEKLLDLALELNMKEEELIRAEPLASAVAYTHFLSWLANYANPGEQAMTLIVNLPVWGYVVSKLAKEFKDRYGIKKTEFLELFAGPYDSLEAEALEIIKNYLPESEYRMRTFSKLIQEYELMFWNSLTR